MQKGVENRVFVYDALRRQMNHPLSHLLTRDAKFLGVGVVRGKLYDLGRSAAAVLSGHETDYVVGEVYQLQRPNRLLPVLDQYEGSRFKRTAAIISLGSNRELFCWIYLYRRPVRGRIIIPGGDYLQYRSHASALIWQGATEMSATSTNGDSGKRSAHVSHGYKSLKGIVERAFQRRITDSVAQGKGNNNVFSFSNHLDGLGEIVENRLHRWKMAVKESEALVNGEAQQTEQLNESLKATIGTLEAKLREKTDIVRKKDATSKKMEVAFSGKINDLQSEVTKKGEFLENRANEIRDLAAIMDAHVKRKAQLDQTLRQTKAEAASRTKHAENLSETKMRLAALETQLRKKEEMIREKDTIIKKLEDDLTTKIQDFENKVKEKEKLLAVRDQEASALESQLKLLTNGIQQFSFVFRKAEMLAAIEVRDIDKIFPDDK